MLCRRSVFLLLLHCSCYERGFESLCAVQLGGALPLPQHSFRGACVCVCVCRSSLFMLFFYSVCLTPTWSCALLIKTDKPDMFFSWVFLLHFIHWGLMRCLFYPLWCRLILIICFCVICSALLLVRSVSSTPGVDQQCPRRFLLLPGEPHQSQLQACGLQRRSGR